MNFLGKLLPEAHDHLAHTLTASVLGVKLFSLPFHRQIRLQRHTLRAMRAALLHCQQVGLLLHCSLELWTPSIWRSWLHCAIHKSAVASSGSNCQNPNNNVTSSFCM
jgi:hypothetical protein